MSPGRFVAAIVVLCLGWAGAVAAQQPERRVALVIGNDKYANVVSLAKAVNDGRAMAATLRGVGFDVLAHENLDRRAMNRAIGDFVDRIAGGAVGLFYFAGHGVQIGGSNYLLPVDVPALRNQEDVRDEAIDLARVLDRLGEAKARLNIMIVDACRDNPFPRVAGRSVGATRGLSVQAAPKGIMIVYSAGANESAIDSLGPSDPSPNGLFTRELLPLVKTPGLRLDEAVRQARRSVSAKAAAIGADQNPAIYDQLEGEFYFVPKPAAVAAVAPAPSPVDERQFELAFWNAIQNSPNPGDFQDYLARYPNGTFASLARRKIETMPGVAPTAAPKVDPTPPRGAVVAEAPASTARTTPTAPAPAPSPQPQAVPPAASPQVAALAPAKPADGTWTATSDDGTCRWRSAMTVRDGVASGYISLDVTVWRGTNALDETYQITAQPADQVFLKVDQRVVISGALAELKATMPSRCRDAVLRHVRKQ